MSNTPVSALIVGAGSGLSAALAREFTSHGVAVTLAARRPDKLAALCAQTGATAVACDAAQPAQVAALFESLPAAGPDLVVYNASGRLRGPITGLDPAGVADAIAVSAYGGFLVGQAAARRMLAPGRQGRDIRGAILFTGASASVKGYAQSAAFAMGKFALRGLAQSMARELAPQGVHVAHFVIDGGIRDPSRPERIDPADAPDSMLDPAAIAATYWHVATQPRSAWTWEVELRPWLERF
jgi:NAD(P)-dependent dehydrogenase (short-subunit alcohol dehydrogenase family)